MKLLKPRYNKEEFAHRGKEIYERNIRSHVQADDVGKFVAIDIETGAYEIDKNDYVATERLLSHHPDSQIWLMRVGHRAAYRISVRPISEVE